jgi:PEGA domain-containing protein
MLADRAGVLDRKLDALLDAPPVVRLESKPAGALVWLDGGLVGVAPQQRTVTEGRHRARAELRGHLPIEVQFDALAGTRETVALELSPLPEPSPTLQRAGWGVLAVGLAGIAVGAPLLALHGRSYPGRCSGDDVDDDGDCRFRYDTRAGGAIAVAVGGAAVVAGIVLLVRAHRPTHRRARAELRGTTLTF